ncbi:hypothetical protein M011DRAFT_409929 [Sporormia fimetaria CBS 119925]|uniref:Myb-like domain-containing protein n=1 Tax=Sporormia fimetaria CBS 119925 TaxID=1340428 RepID=A0A6A6V031_9PLEO|nr:hypothetical protein M011DRAFT_409929 [Sporormia fimetaria CBS 119925]
MGIPTNIAAPQPRRPYAPIAPHPLGLQRITVPKRSRDEDELSDQQSRKRKRSDSSTTTPVELKDDEVLLLKLKEEENLPWKDIAARFQSDLGETVQIATLQMRLNRLRARLRVWTDKDIEHLKQAHDFWVRSKFDIMSEKVSKNKFEIISEKPWKATQVAKKWAEIDPGPTPYTSYEHHTTQSYAPYTMSPVEQSSYMPYLELP